MEKKVFSKGEVIFKEGAFEMWMYALLEGEVGIYAEYQGEREKLLTELKAEDKAFFGEMALVDAMPRSATAVALTDCTLQVVDGNDFGDYFRDRPEDVLKIMQAMSGRVRDLSKKYLDACRAVAEAVESEKTGKEKSGWFKSKVNQFIEDFAAGYDAAMRYGMPTRFW